MLTEISKRILNIEVTGAKNVIARKCADFIV